MRDNVSKENLNEEKISYEEEVKFGYIPSIIFLLFIGFVIYTSLQ